MEVFAGEAHQGFIAIHLHLLLYLVGSKCVCGFHRQQVTTTEKPRHFCHSDMIRQPVVIHRDIPFRQRLNEILLGDASFVNSRLCKDFTDSQQLLVRDADSVAVHPPLGDADGFRRTKIEYRTIVLGCNQLPGATHQVKTDDTPTIVSLFESLRRRLLSAHLHRPTHQAILLCLHGAQVAHHLSRVAKLRRNQLLVKKTYGDRIHHLSIRSNALKSTKSTCLP